MKKMIMACVVLATTLLVAYGDAAANAAPSAPTLNRIPGTGSVKIPAGLSNAQAIEAVARTAVGIGNWVAGRWVVESRDVSNQWIRVNLTVRQHAMTVCYRIENGMLVPDVPQSTNLNQDGSKIHRNVPGWINRFNNRISQHFSEVGAKPAAATQPAPVANFCPGCGKKVAADANFCGSCGRKLR